MTPDELTALHFQIVARILAGDRPAAVELLRAHAAQEADLLARALFDTAFLATALGAERGWTVEQTVAWLDSFSDPEPPQLEVVR